MYCILHQWVLNYINSSLISVDNLFNALAYGKNGRAKAEMILFEDEITKKLAPDLIKWVSLSNGKGYHQYSPLSQTSTHSCSIVFILIHWKTQKPYTHTDTHVHLQNTNASAYTHRAKGICILVRGSSHRKTSCMASSLSFFIVCLWCPVCAHWLSFNPSQNTHSHACMIPTYPSSLHLFATHKCCSAFQCYREQQHSFFYKMYVSPHGAATQWDYRELSPCFSSLVRIHFNIKTISLIFCWHLSNQRPLTY